MLNKFGTLTVARDYYDHAGVVVRRDSIDEVYSVRTRFNLGRDEFRPIIQIDKPKKSTLGKLVALIYNKLS
jgi:hypothetical protein